MPRFEFDPGYGGRFDFRVLLLAVPFAAALIFDQTVTYLHQRVFPPAGDMGGPLAPGWLFWPGMLLGLYVLVSFLVMRPKVFPFVGDYLAAFFTGRHGLLTMVVLIATIVASLYGVAAFWHATGTSVTLHPDIWSAERSYAWADARTGTLICGGRGLSPVRLNIGLPDGAWVDLGTAGEAELGRQFPGVSGKLGKARVALGRVRTCPAFLSDFISAHRSQVQ